MGGVIKQLIRCHPSVVSWTSAWGFLLQSLLITYFKDVLSPTMLLCGSAGAPSDHLLWMTCYDSVLYVCCLCLCFFPLCIALDLLYFCFLFILCFFPIYILPTFCCFFVHMCPCLCMLHIFVTLLNFPLYFFGRVCLRFFLLVLLNADLPIITH